MRDEGRARLTTAAGVAALLAAGPAHACNAEAPIAWDRTYGEGGPAMFVGRVVSVDVQPTPRRTRSFEVTFALATIERVRTVQGEPSERYTVEGAATVRVLQQDAPLWCGEFMQLKPGQTVVAIERRDGSIRALTDWEAAPDELKALVEGAQ